MSSSIQTSSTNDATSSPVASCAAAATASASSALVNASPLKKEQYIELQIPNSIIRFRAKAHVDDSPSVQAHEAGEGDADKSSSAAAAAAAKRKGSFKKWLRSSHRKFTLNSSTRTIKEGTATTSSSTPSSTTTHNNDLKYSELESLKIKVWRRTLLIILVWITKSSFIHSFVCVFRKC